MQTARVGIKVKGDYNPVDLFNNLNQLAEMKRLPNRLAEAFRAMLVQNIKNNIYNFELSQAWVKIKQQKGWDTRPFMAEGHYLNNLQIFTRDGHLTVGFRKTARHPRSGLTYGEIALLLEYGRMDKGIISRPLWRNTMKDFFRTIKKDIKKEIIRIIKDARI